MPAVITDPNIAYLLLLAGIYGLLVEFVKPEAMYPGVVGGICLLVGMYALNLLLVNYAGVALLLLGMALMTAEAFMPSFGILGTSRIGAGLRARRNDAVKRARPPAFRAVQEQLARSPVRIRCWSSRGR